MCTMCRDLGWIGREKCLCPDLSLMSDSPEGDQTINKSLQHNVESVDVCMCKVPWECWKWATSHVGSKRKKAIKKHFTKEVYFSWVVWSERVRVILEDKQRPKENKIHITSRQPEQFMLDFKINFKSRRELNFPNDFWEIQALTWKQ